MKVYRKTKTFIPGQWIYGIEIVNNDFKNAKVAGFMYMGECKNYIICCSKYETCDDFAQQLMTMYKESVKEKSVCLNLLRKEFTFYKKEDAYKSLHKLQTKFSKSMENIKNESDI